MDQADPLAVREVWERMAHGGVEPEVLTVRVSGGKLSRGNSGRRGHNVAGGVRQALVSRQRLGPICSAGCGRTATRASGFKLCWYCDPKVPAEVKLGARMAGGRAPKGAIRYLPPESPDPLFRTPEDRIAFREAVAGAVLRGELSEGPAGVGLRACDGCGEDDERRIVARLDAMERALRLKKAGNW